jgi:hypothetical protein
VRVSTFIISGSLTDVSFLESQGRVSHLSRHACAQSVFCADGRLADLRDQLKTIVGEPNNLKDNLLK